MWQNIFSTPANRFGAWGLAVCVCVHTCMCLRACVCLCVFAFLKAASWNTKNMETKHRKTKEEKTKPPQARDEGCRWQIGSPPLHRPSRRRRGYLRPHRYVADKALGKVRGEIDRQQQRPRCFQGHTTGNAQASVPGEEVIAGVPVGGNAPTHLTGAHLLPRIHQEGVRPMSCEKKKHWGCPHYALRAPEPLFAQLLLQLLQALADGQPPAIGSMPYRLHTSSLLPIVAFELLRPFPNFRDFLRTS